MTNLEKAIKKFRLIIDDYKTQERLKVLAEITGVQDFKILSHWSRSLQATNYDLRHPDYLEYKAHYQVGDVDWLPEGRSFVNLEKYLKYKNKEV